MKKYYKLKSGKSIDLGAIIGYIVQDKTNWQEFSVNHPGYFFDFVSANKFYKEQTDKGLDYEKPVPYKIEAEFIKMRSNYRQRFNQQAQERAAQTVYDLYFAPGKKFFRRK